MPERLPAASAPAAGTPQSSPLPRGSGVGPEAGEGGPGGLGRGPEVEQARRQGMVRQAAARLPLAFEANRGQTDRQVQFVSRGPGYALFLTGSEAVLSLRGSGVTGRERPGRGAAARGAAAGGVLRMRTLGANPRPSAVPEGRLAGYSNYFRGHDPRKWIRKVPQFSRVRYAQVYPGVDLVYYGTSQRQLEYDFVVAPGADYRQIRVGFEGADTLRIERSGDLVARVAGGVVRLPKPLIYQEVDGQRREVPGGYARAGKREIAFNVGPHDARRPLVIDPSVQYGSYLGGSGLDYVSAVAVDPQDIAYVTGCTMSLNFPRQGSLGGAYGGTLDAFVTKFNPGGSALSWSTYLGGNEMDAGLGIAVNRMDLSVYTLGYTLSGNFPVSNSAWQKTRRAGWSDLFVTKLDMQGNLFYSTYVGGNGDDGWDYDITWEDPPVNDRLVDLVGAWGGIAVNDAGEATLTSFTTSTDYPTVAPVLGVFQGGKCDVVVTKLNTAGSGPVYSTYLGGSQTDVGRAVTLDAAGNAYVTGYTNGSFPVTAGSYQTTNRGGAEAFVTKLNLSGSVVYSTYLGGSLMDGGSGIGVDVLGRAWVAGATNSPDFPTVFAEDQVGLRGGIDLFVSKLDETGKVLLFSTFLGGSGNDGGLPTFPHPYHLGILVHDRYLDYTGVGLTVAAGGEACVTGYTASGDFPLVNPTQANPGGGGTDAFVCQLHSTGPLLFSTYLGGGGNENYTPPAAYPPRTYGTINRCLVIGEGSFGNGFGIAADLSGKIYASGLTASSDLPNTNGFQSSNGGAPDGYLYKINPPVYKPDLLIKKEADPVTDYAIDNEYQMAPLGDQIETDSVAPARTATFDVKLQNDGDGAWRYVLRAGVDETEGWTVKYEDSNGSDITTALFSADGYRTAMMQPGDQQFVKIKLTPDAATLGYSKKVVTLQAHIVKGDAFVRDIVQAEATVYRPDLQIKRKSEDNTKYGVDDVFQGVPGNDQIETVTNDPDGPWEFSVMVQNDGPEAHTYVLKGAETGSTGWTTTYSGGSGGSTDVKDSILATGGYTTTSITSGESEIVTITMTPDVGLAGAMYREVTLQVYVDGTDVTVRDAVLARSQLARPDLLIKMGSDLDALYGTDGVYQTPDASGNQIETQVVDPNVKAIYHVKLENDSRTYGRYLIKATEAVGAGWSTLYKIGNLDITGDIKTNNGYTTEDLKSVGVTGNSITVTVEVLPGSLAAGGSMKGINVVAYIPGKVGKVFDAVRMETTVNSVADRPDILIKAAGEPDTAFAIDNIYQAEPAGDQIKAVPLDPGASAAYQIRIENDGNTVSKTYVLKARESADTGWTLSYAKADGTPINAEVRSPSGYLTANLQPGASELISVTMSPDAALAGGSRKTATLDLFLDDTEQTPRDSVQAYAFVSRPDLLINKASEGGDLYGVDNAYQATPDGDQVESQSTDRGVAVVYQVPVENDSLAPRAFVVKAAESAEEGWTTLYQVGTADISAQVRGASGYTTGSLGIGAREIIKVTMTPGSDAIGGTTRSVTLNAYLSGSDTTVRDSVKAVTTVNPVVMADLLVKKTADPVSAYALDDLRQTTPDGDQIEAQSTAPLSAASYDVKVQNDGNNPRTFVVRAGESKEAGWTVTYRVGATDITEQIRSAGGYTTGTLALAGAEVITVEVTPARSVAGNTSKSIVVDVRYDDADTTVRDAVGLLTTALTVEKADLLIKGDRQAETAFASDDVYQTTAAAGQIKPLSVAPGATAVYNVKVENDGNTKRAFVLKASESVTSNWVILYRSGDTDITARIRGTDGYPTAVLDPGAAETLRVEVTAQATAALQSVKSFTIVALLAAADTAVSDAVQGTATAEILTQPDLLAKRAADADSEYAVNDVYQLSPEGDQIKTDTILPGATATYQVRVQNDGTTTRTFILRASESTQTGWVLSYKVGSTDITSQVRTTAGYTTSSLAPDSVETITVTMVSPSAAVGASVTSTSLNVFLTAADAAARDSVQLITTAVVIEKADLQIKGGQEGDSAYAINDTYQDSPAGSQVETQAAAVGGSATYQVRIENDGNTTRSFLLKAEGSDHKGWTVAYKVGTADIGEAITSTDGFTTANLIPGGRQTITISMTPAETADPAKSVVIRAYLDDKDGTTRDSVRAETTIRVIEQPDLLIKVTGEDDSAYAEGNVYQSVPADRQVRALRTAPGTKATYLVRVKNDGNTKRKFVVKAVESAETGWTVSYRRSMTDILAQVTSEGGYQTIDLEPGAMDTLTVEMVPGAAVAGNATKTTTLRVFLDGADATVRDAVQATTTTAVVDQPDLLIKTDSQADTAYAVNNAYQATPAGDQVETQGVGAGSAAVYQVKLENDGNSVRSFVLKTSEDAESGWTVTYTISDSEITGAIRNAGYTTPILEAGGSATIRVQVAPGTGVVRGKQKAVTLSAYGSGSDTLAWDAVQAMTTLENLPPTAPELMAPAAGGVVGQTPTFRVKGTDPESDRIKVQVKLTRGETEQLYTTDLAPSPSEVAIIVPAEQALACGEWTWQARSTDESGAEGAWSEARTLIINREPGVPVLVAPEANAVVSPTPTFRVTATDPDGDPVKFAIEVWQGDRKGTFETEQVDSQAEAKLVVSTQMALNSGQWSWRAKAIDVRGTEGAWSAASGITIPASQPDVASRPGLTTFGLAMVSEPASPTELGLVGARVAVWDAAQQRYLVDSEVQQIAPGMGCWVRSLQPLPLHFTGRAPDAPFAIHLKPGWNLISVPFVNAVSWDLLGIVVRRGPEQRTLAGAGVAGWINDYAWGWQRDSRDPNAGGYVLVYDRWILPGMASQLEPWQSYWVKAKVECDLVLPVPQAGAGRTRLRADEATGWSARLRVRTPGGVGEVVLGVRGDGRAFTVGRPPEPPAQETPVSVSLAGSGGPLVVDVRQGATRRQEWTLQVATAARSGQGETEDTVLSWPDLRALPKNVSLILEDTVTGSRRYLRTTPEYRFRATGGARQFRITAEAGAGPAVAITGLEVVQAAGQRAGAGRLVRFVLSREAEVDVDVLSPDGRGVAAVARGRAAGSGVNQVAWTGSAVPGVYLLRVTARTQEGARTQATRPVLIAR